MNERVKFGEGTGTPYSRLRKKLQKSWYALSAIDEIEKIFFKRLYLVSGLTPVYILCNHALGAPTPTEYYRTISRYLCPFFFRENDSQSNLEGIRTPY